MPFASRAEARVRQRSLAARGIEDVVVISGDDGQFLLALGFFRDVANARARRSRMAQLGLPVQQVTPRMMKTRVYWVDVVGKSMPEELWDLWRKTHAGVSSRSRDCVGLLPNADTPGAPSNVKAARTVQAPAGRSRTRDPADGVPVPKTPLRREQGGDAEAQTLLAHTYRDVQGVPEDPDQAAKRLLKTATQGHAQAAPTRQSPAQRPDPARLAARSKPGGFPEIRLGDELPVLPRFLEPTPAPRARPPPPAPRPRSPSAAQFKVEVKKITLVGNTVFSDEDLAEVTTPYLGEITSDELQGLRYALTQYYVQRGYVNSGALIPDQQVEDGIITLRIIEGRLSHIEVSGNRRLREPYIRKSLEHDPHEPLSLHELQQQLQLLQQDPLVERINARLLPGVRRGDAQLALKLTEARPYQFGVRFANDRSPSIGGEHGQIYATTRNLSGWGDSLGVRTGLTSGSTDLSAFYTLPLNGPRTRLNIRAQREAAEVIEEPFDALDIESEQKTFGIGVEHTIIREPRRFFAMGLRLDLRRTETTLLGRPFSFSEGARDGVSKVSAVRVSQDWSHRSANRVLASRSTFSFGIDAFGTTANDTRPDGQFIGWLGQFQMAQRLPWRGAQQLFRTYVQLTDSPLLTMEKFSIGGPKTVRGYRKSQLVRDNAFVASLELQVPVARLPIPDSGVAGDGLVQFAVFADYGNGWNTDRTTPNPRWIGSLGVGVLWDPAPNLHAELYWGNQLQEVVNPTNDLQNTGIHFKVELVYP